MYSRIDILHNVLSKRECRNLIEYGNSFLHKKILTDSRPRGFRTNFISILKQGSHELLDKLSDIVVKKYNLNHKQIEGYIYNYYRKGEKVHNHFDYIAENDPQMQAGGQRLYTVILSLSDDYLGGETGFPYFGENFKEKTGSLLIFKAYNSGNELDKNTLHCANPVLKGNKYNIVFFIREKEAIN